ncbi:MAG: hypothetical protein GF346_04985 [Candidatus Eisenbacteria bacterium]|nr:hypothetical protein [Candidatus Latescibacterota bacterium]MBD3301781.1 hypothetical protein [Candidatus Eisenbacteria bacterium]
MKGVLEIPVAGILPDRPSLAGRLGLPPGAPIDERLHTILEDALRLCEEEARPAGVFVEIDRDRFAAVYRGAGRNEPETPLEAIVPRAEHLTLFAVTIGQAVSARIDRLFEEAEYPIAAALDAAASEATERAGDRLEETVRAKLRARAGPEADRGVLRYSPGYCGWHVSGQAALFDALEPGRIGIRLRESFLMEPLKSMSGVIVAGAPEIHDFEDRYPFCSDCTERGCRERIRRVSGRGSTA